MNSQKHSFSRDELIEFYWYKDMSAKEIAERHDCSTSKINYWLKKYHISKRTISESAYLKSNPNGDPFRFVRPANAHEAFLAGLGFGLYWGEGNKRNRNSVRLGNTDPGLIRTFIHFLEVIYQVSPDKFKFGLQIFSDTSPQEAMLFWCSTLKVRPEQFGKPIVTPSRGAGTYRRKIEHGVLTVYVCNTKLRNHLCGEIEKLQKMTYYPNVLEDTPM